MYQDALSKKFGWLNFIISAQKPHFYCFYYTLHTMYSTGNIKRIISKTKRNNNLRFPSTFQRQIFTSKN